jgi:hypothetical protein
MAVLIRARVFAALALLFALPSLGCFSFGDLDWRGHKRQLTDTQLKYAHFLRWGEYQAAAYLVRPEEREAFLAEIKPFENGVRLSDYEVLDTEFNPARTEATVMVTFSAYHLNRLVEHKWTEKQIWHRDLATEEWHVKPDLEVIRKVATELEPK